MTGTAFNGDGSALTNVSGPTSAGYMFFYDQTQQTFTASVTPKTVTFDLPLSQGSG